MSALVDRVGTSRCVDTTSASVADLAKTTLVGRILEVRVEGAATLEAGDVAGAAVTGTRVVAAVAVNAEAGGALTRAGARLTVLLLGHARCPGAVVAGATVRATCTTTSTRARAALVRATRGRTCVQTLTASVASVCQVPRAIGTCLRIANRPISPQHTATGTVTITLLPASRCKLLVTVAEQVEVERLVDASARAVAHLARVAFALGVGATGVLTARSQLPGNVASLAGAPATGVAAVPVDAKPAGAFTGSRTSLAVGLLGQASRAVAIAVGTAVHIRRATGLAGIELTLVRATRLGRSVVACT